MRHPCALQDHLIASDSLILQTSLSADCLLQAPVSIAGPGQPSAFGHWQQPSSQQCKAPHQQSSLRFDSETDENRPPLPFNASNMPASLSERVRQQAKTRISRVKVVRKAANVSMHSSSLDFDRMSQPLNATSHNVLQPSNARGITSAFQLSWPPPAAFTAAVGVSPVSQYASSFTGTCPAF